MAGLDVDKYYIRLVLANDAATPPIAEQLWPVDGQYFDLTFDEGNLSAPEGRLRTEETGIVHRGRGVTATVHYIHGPDGPIFEPQEISFSVRLDSVINKTALELALACGNPDYNSAWDATGVSTKGDTTVVGGTGVAVTTPAFVDASKKTVCVQILWTRDDVAIGRSYNEVYFPPDQLTIAEAEDGIIVSATGQIYGLIESIYWLAYRF